MPSLISTAETGTEIPFSAPTRKATWATAKSDCAAYSYERLHDKGIGATGPWTDVEIRNDVPTRRRAG